MLYYKIMGRPLCSLARRQRTLFWKHSSRNKGVPLLHSCWTARTIPSLLYPCGYHYTDFPIFVPLPNPQKDGNTKNFLAVFVKKDGKRVGKPILRRKTHETTVLDLAGRIAACMFSGRLRRKAPARSGRTCHTDSVAYLWRAG